MNKIPIEIVEFIIEYVDYIKYHKKIYKNVLEDINDISNIFTKDNNLPPNIVYTCWGNGWNKFNTNLHEEDNSSIYSDIESIDSFN